MQRLILTAMLFVALSAPTFAASYPVSGRWGQSAGTEKGRIDCNKLRVIEFDGEERTDSGGGVPPFRLRSIEAEGSSSYRVVDEFTTGQISSAQAVYTLTKIDVDRIELNMTP